MAVVSVAGVPLEARRVCGQFQGPEAQGPPPPTGALTAPWWQVKPPLAPGGLRGTALGPPFRSARVQRGTTKTRRCPSSATATPRSTARRQPRLATQVGGFGALFYPHADPASATEVKTNSPPPSAPGYNQMHPPGSQILIEGSFAVAVATKKCCTGIALHTLHNTPKKDKRGAAESQ